MSDTKIILLPGDHAGDFWDKHKPGTDYWPNNTQAPPSIIKLLLHTGVLVETTEFNECVVIGAEGSWGISVGGQCKVSDGWKDIVQQLETKGESEHIHELWLHHAAMQGLVIFEDDNTKRLFEKNNC